jgi:nucleoid DNA-binding protein
MTKEDLATELAHRLEIPRRTASEFLTTLTEVVHRRLIEGDVIHLCRVGSLYSRSRPDGLRLAKFRASRILKKDLMRYLDLD